MVKDELAVPAALEKHFSLHGVRASDVRTYLGHKVYLAEGGPHYDAKKLPGLPPDMEWMKAGYYIAVWGVLRGLAVWGRPAYFEINHNPELTIDTKKYARLNAAMGDAEDYIETGVRAGLLKNKSVIWMPAHA